MRPFLDASRPHRPRVHLSEAQRGCLHSGGSSCDRCHAGKRNVVIRPIAEIDDRSTARPNTRAEGANACPEHRSGLPRLLPFPLRRVERNLLDNVRRVHLIAAVELDRGKLEQTGNVDAGKEDIGRRKCF